jgi:hypothetical protein
MTWDRLASLRIAVAAVMLPRGAFQTVQTVKSMTDGGGDAELQAARDEGDHQHQLCNIISRDEAKALDLKRYFTGKPCRHGHIAERNVRSGRCLECFREYQQEYQHARRAANLEKVREREREAARKHRTVDPEGYRSQQAAWRAANKEKIAAYKRQWYLKNKRKVRSQQAAWRAANKNRRSPTRQP